MKYFTVASALVVAAAVAQPHGNHHRRHHEHEHEKRAMYTKTEWVVETQYVTELVDSTTTVWIGYGATSTEQAKFVETSHSKVSSSTSTSTSTTEAYSTPEPETTTSSSSVYVAPTTSTSSSSVYVAPPQSSTTKEKSTYVAPVPTTTSVYVAPSSTYVAPVATTSASSDSGSGSGGSGTTYSGEITYYTLGLGSCGEDDGGLDLTSNVVAIAAEMMGGTSYDTTYCGKTITIKANGNTCQGVIRDKCPGCSGGSIDVSEKIFTELWGGLDKGRGEVEWYFN